MKRSNEPIPPSKERMDEILAIMNERRGLSMREFAKHCESFYKPNCGRRLAASRRIVSMNCGFSNSVAISV